MAYAGQYFQGIEALFNSMTVPLHKPILFCDNRAACYISAGAGEWRTKALTNRVLGLRSLVELGMLEISFKPTGEMAADVLTKFMKKGVLQRCRALIGCIPLPAVQTV